MTPLILASGSRYRAQLLGRLGLPFSVQSPDIDESPRPGETPAALAERLSREKAMAIARRVDRGLVIGSDQVADCGGTILGKPGTAGRAREQLRLVSGRTVSFWTGLALADAASEDVQSTVVRCDVVFRDLGDEEIARYITIEQPLDCAGSFKSEGLGVVLFRRIASDDPTSLVGLPLIALCDFLRRAGVTLP